MELQKRKPVSETQMVSKMSPEDQLRERVRLELAERAQRREEARSAVAQAVPEAIEKPASVEIPESIPEPEKELEVLEVESQTSVSVVVESTNDAVHEVRDDIDELFEEQKAPVIEFSQVDLAHYETTFLGEGRQCKVSKLKHPHTDESFLLFQARPGTEGKLALHADILRQLQGSEHFLSVRYFSEGSDTEAAYMVCEDPGTVPLVDKIDELDLQQRMKLVPQLVAAFRRLHERARMLHTDPFPKQLYVVQKDSEVQLILSDLGDAQEVGKEMESCQNSLLEENDQSTALFNTSFASADRRRGFPYDQSAEMEVVARLATWILTGKEPIDGVRPTLEEFREGLQEVSPELDDMIVRVTVAAEKNREKRYPHMRAFSEALASTKQLQMSQGKSLGLRVDFDRLDSPEAVAHLRKSLGDVDVKDLDPRLVKAFEKLEKDEARIIEELGELRKKRQDEYTKKNEHKNTTLVTGDHVIINALRFPSDRVQRCAIETAFDHLSQFYQLTRVSEAVKAAARNILYSSSFSDNNILQKYLRASYSLSSCSGIYTPEGNNITSRIPQKEVEIAMKLVSSRYLSYKAIESALCCLLTHVDILPPGALVKWGDAFINEKILPGGELLRFLSRSGAECLGIVRKICISLAKLKGANADYHGAADVIYFILETFDGPAAAQNEASHAMVDEIKEGSVYYKALTPSVISHALRYGKISKTWAVKTLRKLNKPLDYSDFKAILPDCSLQENEIDMQALAFALERKGDSRESSRAFIEAKYDGLLRKRIASSLQKNDTEGVEKLRKELRELLGETDYALSCLEDGYKDVAFDIIEKKPSMSTEQYTRLFEISSHQILQDESLPRINSYLSVRKINRGYKRNIRDTRYDTILGEAVNNISKHNYHYLKRYLDQLGGGGEDRIDFTDRGYKCLDKIFALLADITRSSEEKEQGNFENAATKLLDTFRELHPDVFDTYQNDGTLTTKLKLRRVGNHMRYRDEYNFYKNPDKAIEIRNKYAGL